MKKSGLRDFPGVHWLRLHVQRRGVGSILGGGTKIPHAVPSSNKKQKHASHIYCLFPKKDVGAFAHILKAAIEEEITH